MPQCWCCKGVGSVYRPPTTRRFHKQICLRAQCKEMGRKKLWNMYVHVNGCNYCGCPAENVATAFAWSTCFVSSTTLWIPTSFFNDGHVWYATTEIFQAKQEDVLLESIQFTFTDPALLSKKLLLRASVMEKPVGFGKTRCLCSWSRQVLMNVIFLHLFFPTSSQPWFSLCKQKQLCSTFFPTPRFLAVIFRWDRYVAKQGKHGPEGIHHWCLQAER